MNDLVKFTDLKEKDGLVLSDISKEEYREYSWKDRPNYRIDNPIGLYYRINGTTHRIVDQNGITHCVPAPGLNGCALRWKTPKEFVSF